MENHVEEKPPNFHLSIRSVDEEAVNGNRSVGGDWAGLIGDGVVAEENELEIEEKKLAHFKLPFSISPNIPRPE